MGGKTRRGEATQERRLHPERRTCPDCGQVLRMGYVSWRKVATLEGLVRLKVSIGRCENRDCARYHRPYHPAEEGRWVLPHYEYGLDVMALIGAQRYRDHTSAPQIHAALLARHVQISQRNVQYLLERYDELVALSVRDDAARRARLMAQGRLILAIDGLQPDVGQEVLWVVREVISGEVLVARSLLSSCRQELAGVLREAVAGLEVPVVGVVSDGQHSIHCAVTEVFPEVPHQLCQFHYLKQAAGPAWEADRHAKKELKKRVRGIRPVERTVAGRDDEAAQVVQGYCAAVRGALTDEGKAPLEPGGLQLHDRLEMISASLERAAQKGGAAKTAPPDPAHPPASPRGHGRALAAPAADLRLDPPGGRPAGQSAAATGGGRAGAVSGPAGGARHPTGHTRRRGDSRLGNTLSEDHSKLLGRAVPLLRCRRMTAH